MNLSEKFSSGLPLSEAARELAGADRIRELDRLTTWCLDNTTLRGTTRGEEWLEAFNAFKVSTLLMERELIDALKEGRLIATGLDSRESPSAPAVAISPDRWHALVPDFSNSTATIHDYQVTGIRVFSPETLQRCADLSDQKRVSYAELKMWHEGHVDKLRATGRKSSQRRH